MFRKIICIILVFYNSSSITKEQNKGCTKDNCKLSPVMRVVDKNKFELVTNNIKSYLENFYIISREDFKNLPEVSSLEQKQKLATKSQLIFSKDLENKEYTEYAIVKLNSVLKNPNKNKEVGIQMIKLSEARVVKRGKVSTLQIMIDKSPVSIGNKLVPAKSLNLPDVIKGKPGPQIYGHIISIDSNLAIGDNFNVLTISMGKNKGISVGDMFSVKTIKEKKSSKVDDYLANIMVFHVDKDVSLAITFKMENPVSLYDEVIPFSPFFIDRQ